MRGGVAHGDILAFFFKKKKSINNVQLASAQLSREKAAPAMQIRACLCPGLHASSVRDYHIISYRATHYVRASVHVLLSFR